MAFARYVSVQVVAYGLDMGGFLLLHAMGTGPLVSNVFGKVVAGCFAFLAHRGFTFRGAAAGAARSQALLYVGLLAVNVPLSSGVLAALLLIVPLPAAAKFMSDVVCVGLTYWISKRYVFAARRDS